MNVIEFPLVGFSRLLSITSEFPVYVHLIKKESATVDKPGLLELKVSETEKSPLKVQMGEFGSIVLEALNTSETDITGNNVKIAWNITIDSDTGILISGLQGASVYYLHYANRSVVKMPILSKSFWGFRIEKGSEKQYSFKLEFDVPVSILSSSIIVESTDVKEKQE